MEALKGSLSAVSLVVLGAASLTHAYTTGTGVNLHKCHLSLFAMKRRELAQLTGYSERHISRIAAEIPGAKPTSGGQWTFDETNPELIPWISEAKTKKGVQHSKRLGAKKRKSQMPTMTQDMAAIERFVDTFKKLQKTGAEIRIHATGVDFADDTSKEQWIASGAMIKCIKDLPTFDRLLLLLHYFDPSPPEALTTLYAILRLPIFSGLLDKNDESNEAF